MKAASLLVVLSIGLFAGCSSDGAGTGTAGGTGAVAGPRVGSPQTLSDFQKKVNQIQTGTPKGDVIRAIGKPDQNIKGVAGVQLPGPQPPATINAGSRYEHWIYVRGDSEYHIFMGGSTTDPGRWVVMSSSANPIGAVPH
jgi:hypothetical protein